MLIFTVLYLPQAHYTYLSAVGIVQSVIWKRYHWEFYGSVTRNRFCCCYHAEEVYRTSVFLDERIQCFMV